MLNAMKKQEILSGLLEILQAYMILYNYLIIPIGKKD